MSELKEVFSGMEKNKTKKVINKETSHSAMSSYLYFAIPFIVLTSINIFFFYNVSAALALGLNTSMLPILLLLIGLYLTSKFIIAGKLSMREKTLISGALHTLFIAICLITLFIPYNALYVKALLIVWCFFKYKEMIGNLRVIWKSAKSKNEK